MKQSSRNISQFLHPLRTPRVACALLAAAGMVLVLFMRWQIANEHFSPPARPTSRPTMLSFLPATHTSGLAVDARTRHIIHAAEYFVDFPLQQPYKDMYGELGRRCGLVGDWLELYESPSMNPGENELLSQAIESTALSLFPYLAKKTPANSDPNTPIRNLRALVTSGAGIVIPTGSNTLRYAGHLIVSLRTVLHSSLPIQIVYAGEDDLPPSARDFLASLVLPSSASPLTFLDITTVFDEPTLQLRRGSWAIKAFAALASPFAQTIILDADAVFIQPPEVLLSAPTFTRAGTYLFHDRLLWQHLYHDSRHVWWRDQIRRPSAALNVSRVWVEEWSEEADSGAVVLDKARADVFMGLLHVAWQNTKEVREEVTYKVMYGDKESWWLGMELAGAGYEFEKHYGSMIGWEEPSREEGGDSKVCSFTIAHVDEDERLLWFNGGLLKNKLAKNMESVYEVPDHWMLDGTWLKGANKQDMSCTVGDARNLTERETAVLAKSIEKAKEVDQVLRDFR